jgi:hypothetical protein
MIRSRTELQLQLPSLRRVVFPNPSAPSAAPRPASKLKLAFSHQASVRSRDRRKELGARRGAGAGVMACGYLKASVQLRD